MDMCRIAKQLHVCRITYCYQYARAQCFARYASDGLVFRNCPLCSNKRRADGEKCSIINTMIRTKEETTTDRYRSNTDSDPPRTEKDSSKLGKAGEISTQDIQLSQSSNSAPHCSADSQTTPLQSNSTAQPPHGTTDDAGRRHYTLRAVT